MKRHPRHWPKMKLRGARRKYLGAQVFETVRRYSVLTSGSKLSADGRGYTTTFDVVPADTPGARILVQRSWSDGFGRPRKKPVSPPPPKPKPIASERWHLTFAPIGTPAADMMRAFGVAP